MRVRMGGVMVLVAAGWAGLLAEAAHAGEEARPASTARADEVHVPRAAAPCCVEVCAPDPLLRCGRRRACGEWYVGGGPSAFPNVGVFLEAGRVLGESAWGTWSLETRLGWQPIDDKAFIDNGQPAAGDWFQAEVGVALRTAPSARRHWVYRAGMAGFRANGEPNWVDTPGNWAGPYVGVGFQTDLTPSLSVGPSLTFIAAIPFEGDEGVVLTPQLAWGLTWWLGGGSCSSCVRAADSDCGCRPLGELYLDANVTASPGLGGGIGFGQVFERNSHAVLSFEMGSVFQPLEDGTLFGEGEGEFALVYGGLKASFAPRSCRHLVLRGGATWFRNTARIRFVDDALDYLGAYVGVGWEWDLGERVSTGPELVASVMTREGQAVRLEVVPRLSWHVVWKF